MKKQKRVFLALILLIFPFFFFFGPGYGSSRSFQYLWDLGHLLFFALAGYSLFSFLPFLRAKSFGRQLAWILAITLVLGLLIELAQGGFGRTGSFLDMLRNLAGALFSFFFFHPAKDAWPVKTIYACRLLVALALLSAAVPLAAAFTDEINADGDFPVLADFETPLEKSRWAGGAQRKIVSEVARSGRCSLKVFLDTATFSGVALEYFPGNWEGYQTLAFEIYNPAAEPLQLTCRIHDRRHTLGVQYYDDRFNRSFPLQNGWNSIRIDLGEVEKAPKTRRMDMSDICGLGIFAVRLPKPKVIYLDNVRLLAKPSDEKRG